jgi:hypothetical protein
MVNFIQQSGVERETLYLSCIKEYSSNSREREFVDWNAKFIDHFTPAAAPHVNVMWGRLRTLKTHPRLIGFPLRSTRSHSPGRMCLEKVEFNWRMPNPAGECPMRIAKSTRGLLIAQPLSVGHFALGILQLIRAFSS